MSAMNTCKDCIHWDGWYDRCTHDSLKDNPDLQTIGSSFAEECMDYDTGDNDCGHCLGSGKMLDPLDYRQDTSCAVCHGSGKKNQ